MADEPQRTFQGAGGTAGGIGEFVIGLVMAVVGGYLYFRPTSLFATVIMLGLLVGGLGLIARSLRPH
jgi:hypothetical protein